MIKTVYNCVNDTINDKHTSCLELLSNFFSTDIIINFIELINYGNFGAVYKCYLSNDNIDREVAIKIIPDTYENEDDFNNKYLIICEENEFMDKMSNLHVSPTFYWSDIKYENGYMLQMIVMELFDINCYTALKDPNLKNEHLDIIRNMIILLVKQHQHNYYCVDIKCENFVYRYSDNSVRMIDFDTHCSDNIESLSDNLYNSTDFLLLNLVQLLVRTANICKNASIAFLEYPLFYNYYKSRFNGLVDLLNLKTNQTWIVEHNINHSNKDIVEELLNIIDTQTRKKRSRIQ